MRAICFIEVFLSPCRNYDYSKNILFYYTAGGGHEGRMTPTKVKSMEREVERERWLQERQAKESERYDFSILEIFLDLAVLHST